jgi:hypothetical protein
MEKESEIRNFLEKNKHKTFERSGRENETFTFLLDILGKQTQWKNKLDTVNSFRITRSKLNKALILQVKVNKCIRWLTVSWRKSASNKKKDADPLQSAFRQAVRTQIKMWKKINKENAFCTNCHVTSQEKKLHVDHKDPQFIELTRHFLSLPINSCPPSDFLYHYKVGRKFRPEDYLFKKRWQNYHQKNAVLQWLCPSCNMKKKKRYKLNNNAT